MAYFRKPSEPLYKIAPRKLTALAFAAMRANGILHKTEVFFDPESGDTVRVVPNKVLMRNSIDKDPALTPTQEDYKLADAAIADISQEHMVAQLSGRKISPFFETMAVSLQMEYLTERDCGMIAFVPDSYQRLLAQQVKKETLIPMQASSEYLGKVGQKVSFDFVMLDKRYLSQYNCWSISGHDGNGNLVNFLSAHESLGASQRIQGKVKRTEQSKYHNGACVTQLNYVKAI